MRWLIVILLALSFEAEAAEWDAENFPNPTAGEFQKCNMRTTANICDPDGVLSEQSRYRLDNDLKQFEIRTRQFIGSSLCDEKGVTVAMAVARNVKGGSKGAVEMMAKDMLRKWNLDPECKKAIVIVVSTGDMKFWVARETRVPVSTDEFTQFFIKEMAHFQQGRYQQALTNILQAILEKTLSKQRSLLQPILKGAAKRGFKIKWITGWIWILPIIIIIPILCCCCCIYCCCCRMISCNDREKVPTNPQEEGGDQRPPQPPNAGGHGMLLKMIYPGGGRVAVGSLISRFLSNRDDVGENYQRKECYGL
uniref:TPM domain-containing protein n=1 Tax=Caenorhabditis japonica TaxID=281687 RepID=A0A8R1E5H9_CAEJA